MPIANPSLRIADLLSLENIVLDVEANTKDELFGRCGEMFERLYGLSAAQVTTALRDRERLGSTALGYGIAVPHARLSRLSHTLAAFVRARTPIMFDAPDGLPVTDLIVLGVPGHATEEHLQLLADVARLFGSKSFRDEMRDCATAEALQRLILLHSPD